jgi:hypothetical protein
MKKPIIRIHDTATDEIIDREMTDAEHEIYLAEVAARQAEQEADQAKKTEKQAILDRLGLTADEAKLLLS